MEINRCNRVQNLPLSVDLRLTKSCNLCCSFCFGTTCAGTQSVESWCKLIDMLCFHGVKVLVITGGEPTLFPGIKDLLAHAHSRRLKIIFSSNGTHVLDDTILNYVDVLSLPLDGEDYETCHLMRGISPLEYDTVIQNMKNYKDRFPDKQLKIGTVITQWNIDNVQGIYETIRNYADTWKVYQVSPHEKNFHIFSNLEVPDSEFDALAARLDSICAGSVNLVVYRNADRSGKYLFCEPNFDAVSIINNEERVIGNFQNDFAGVLFVWKHSIDANLLANNVKTTYPLILNNQE